MAGRADLVTQFGDDPIAFSTLQDGLRYCETSYGYIAYQRVLGIDITLGPPIAAPADRADLIERFLRGSRRPLFCYLRAGDAALVAGLAPNRLGRRLHLASMGLDRLIDARDTPPDATAKKPLRGARKQAQKAGFAVERCDPEALSASQRQRLSAITTAYLSHSQLPYEMRFLNRPFTATQPGGGTAGERLYLLQQQAAPDAEKSLFGYAVLNPWYDGGKVAGYLLDIVRFLPTRQWGVYMALVDRLLADLAAAGIHQLSLGFCPLHGTGSEISRRALAQATTSSGAAISPLLSRQVGWLEQYLAAVPYVQRLVEIKSALPGHYEPRYFVSYTASALHAFFALLGACGVSLPSIIGPRLLTSIVAGARRPPKAGGQ